MWRKQRTMEFESTPIPGLTVITPRRFCDPRGYFSEVYNKELFESVLGQVNFIQDNESESTKGVLRGLHAQTGKYAQAKLVRVVEGAVFDVAVDARPESADFGKWYGTELSHRNGKMLFIPRGFLHGFLVLSDYARFVYKVDNVYAPQAEITVSYDDPDIAIGWPDVGVKYLLSEKDRLNSLRFKELIGLNPELQTHNQG